MIYLLSILIAVLIGTLYCIFHMKKQYDRLHADYTIALESEEEMADKLECLTDQIHSMTEEMKASKPPVITDDYDYHAQFLMPVLQKMGCNPQSDKDDNLIIFRYQGWTFFLKGPATSSVQRVILPSILSVPQDDPQLSAIIEGCNSAQRNWGPKIVWELSENIDGADIVYNFNMLLDQVILPIHEDSEAYIATLLDSFASAADDLRMTLRRLNGDKISELERDIFWKFTPKTIINKARFN